MDDINFYCIECIEKLAIKGIKESDVVCYGYPQNCKYLEKIRKVIAEKKGEKRNESIR